MKCKFCGEELPERGNFCPVCGRDNSEGNKYSMSPGDTEPGYGYVPSRDIGVNDILDDFAPICENVVNDDVEIVPPETEIPEEPVDETLAPQVKKIKRNAAISGCIAVLAVLALLLFFGIRGSNGESGEGLDIAGWFDWEIFRENDLFKKDSYTVSDQKAQQKADVVVATLGDAKLTNGELQVYYQMEVVEFLNQFGYYLSYFGLDYTKPLDQQACMLLEGYTWQQFFLESALNTWKQSQALAMKAAETGFQLDSLYQIELDSLEQDLTNAALQSGYASAEELLHAQCGANTSFARYQSYMSTMYNAIFFMSQEVGKVETPSNEALADYFAANKESLESQGIKQDGSYTVDVRHILLKVEGGVENADGTITFADEALAAEAYAEAQRLLEEYQADPTETHFADLAKEHTADGNGAQGGLYTGVYVGQMVKTFEDWCFDESRQPGDTGIVATKFGYHIMYFSARGEDTWLTKTRQAYMAELEQKMEDDIIAQYELEVSYGKIALAHVNMA